MNDQNNNIDNNKEAQPPPPPNVLPKFFPININLHTNLPDDKDETGLATKIITLTGDMLGSSPNKPFFSSEIDYSYGTYFFTDKREEQINVFFNRSTFRKFIIECYNRKLKEINSNDKAFIQSAREEYEKEKKDALEENGIAERNILFMLNMLIKISFPKKTKVKETYSKHKTNVLSVFKDPISALKTFYNPFVYYTYITYEGKDYTVVKAHWQNDFYSHPEFFKLYNLYRLYTEWFNAEKKEEIINKFKAFTTYFTGTQLYSEEIVEYIVMTFAQDFMKYEDAEDYLKTIMTFDGKTLPYEKYDKKKSKIYEVFKEKGYNTIESRENYLKEKKIVAIKDFELISSRTRYSESIKKSQVADFENYKKLIKKIYDFIKDQPDWSNFYELKKETLSKVKENIYNKKLHCLLSDITYLSKKNDTAIVKSSDEDAASSEDKNVATNRNFEESKTQQNVEVATIDKNKPNCDELLKNVRKQIERRDFYVGVQKKGGVNGEFEISLYVDFFGGKIDQKTKNRYKCAFFGEKLGNEFETLWNGQYYVKSRFFFDSKDFDEGTTTNGEILPEKKDDENAPKSEKAKKKDDDRDDDRDDDSDDDSDDDRDDEKTKIKGGNMSRSRRRRRCHHRTLRRRRTSCNKPFGKKRRRRRTLKARRS